MTLAERHQLLLELALMSGRQYSLHREAAARKLGCSIRLLDVCMGHWVWQMRRQKKFPKLKRVK